MVAGGGGAALAAAGAGPSLPLRAMEAPTMPSTATDPRFPVVALIHSIIDCAADGRSRDELLGPPLCRIYERSAIGSLPSNAAPPPSLRVFVCRATKVVGWWMGGLARPNPFFDDRTKVPRSVPQVLSPRADWR